MVMKTKLFVVYDYSKVLHCREQTECTSYKSLPSAKNVGSYNYDLFSQGVLHLITPKSVHKVNDEVILQ